MELIMEQLPIVIRSLNAGRIPHKYISERNNKQDQRNKSYAITSDTTFAVVLSATAITAPVSILIVYVLLRLIPILLIVLGTASLIIRLIGMRGLLFWLSRLLLVLFIVFIVHRIHLPEYSFIPC